MVFILFLNAFKTCSPAADSVISILLYVERRMCARDLETALSLMAVLSGSETHAYCDQAATFMSNSSKACGSGWDNAEDIHMVEVYNDFRRKTY
jgi:hypothetical protein